MRVWMLVSAVALTALGGCDPAPANVPAGHVDSGKHAPIPSDSLDKKQCKAGRRFGFEFFRHAKGPEADKAVRDRFHTDVPGAVVWPGGVDTMTVVVPDQFAGDGVISEARTLHLKVSRVDWVGIAADCSLSWMNHGEMLPPASSDSAALDANGAPSSSAPLDSDAGTPPPTPTVDKALQAKSDACAAALAKDMAPYAKLVDHQTSVASTRMLLRIFAKSCAPSFPELAKAADRSSKVGRSDRSTILAAATKATCPAALKATVASEVVSDCPPVSGDPTLKVWQLLDAGTYSFVETLKRSGFNGSLTDELILQASLHPELDK